MELRTNIGSAVEESTAVWEQLLRLAEDGDIRAIKLYYDMLEKKQHPPSAGGEHEAHQPEQMAAIRRAVFGDAAVDAAAVKASGGTAATAAQSDMGGRTLPVTDADDELQ